MNINSELSLSHFQYLGGSTSHVPPVKPFIARDLTHNEMVEFADKTLKNYSNALFLQYIHLDGKTHPFLCNEDPLFRRKALVHRNIPGLVESEQLQKYEGWTLSNSISNFLSFLKDHAKDFDLISLEEKLKQALYQARVIDWSMGEFLEIQLDQIAQHNLEKVKGLAIGEEMIVPGYWHTMLEEVHAIFYKIKREQNNTYTLITVNTGSGVSLHSKNLSNTKQLDPGYRTIDIPLKKFDKTFFDKLNLISVGKSEKHSYFEMIYWRVLCPLGKADFQHKPEYFGMQKNGVCTHRVLMALVLLEIGKGKYKEFSYKNKVHGFEEFKAWKIKQAEINSNEESEENEKLFKLAQEKLQLRCMKKQRKDGKE